MDGLIVSEKFGPTFQGEGPSCGRRAMFLRLGLCNLDCAWCDTPYTWDWTGKLGVVYERSSLERVSVEALGDWMRGQAAGLLVITGGEPLLQQKGIERLLPFVPTGWQIEIETNGTLTPIDSLARRCQFNVSPKLAHAKTSRDPINVDALMALDACGGRFKFVVADVSDLAEVAEVTSRAGIGPDRVWIMPEGRTTYAMLADFATLADAVLAAGYNLSTRLHVLAWGDERGR